MRWKLASVSALLVLAACGGGSSGRTATGPSGSATTTTVESAETRTWVSAATKALLDSPSAPKNITTTAATCMAHALVDTLTVARMKAGGVKISDLSNPNQNFTPKFAASVPAATKLAIGARLQACGFGHFIGPLVVDSLAQGIGGGYHPDARATACVTAQFAKPSHRLLVGDFLLNSDPSAADSTSLAEVMVDCLDIAAMMAPSLHVTLSSPERACINTRARSDKLFVSAIAADIRGSGNNTSSFTEFGVRMVTCLTPAHILQIGNAHK